jgi:hypothetical protein
MGVDDVDQTVQEGYVTHTASKTAMICEAGVSWAISGEWTSIRQRVSGETGPRRRAWILDLAGRLIMNARSEQKTRD